VSRALWVIYLSALLAYGGWQAYLCFDSYESPAWSYNVALPNSIRYPTVLVCPLGYKAPHSLEGHNATCTYGIDIGDMTFNETRCDLKWVTVLPRNKKSKNQVYCALANYVMPDSNAMAFAFTSVHTYLEVDVYVNHTHGHVEGPLYPVQVSLFSQKVTDYTALMHDFVGMPGNAYWGVVQKSQDLYLNGDVVDSFQVSVSSTANPEDNKGDLSITLSFGSFDVSQSTEYVYFDWLSLLGVLGGAASLAMAGHLLSMLFYEKALVRLYKWIRGKGDYELLQPTDANDLAINGE